MIISVFNPVWCCVIALAPIFILAVTFAGRQKTDAQKQRFLVRLSLVTLLLLVVYKIWLLIDPTYETSIWEELPLNLCNLATLLMVPAVRRNSRLLKAFLYYCAPLGAIMALVMPSEGFYDVPVYLLRCIGYWISHLLVLIVPILLVTLGSYRPRFRDIPAALLLLLGLALVAHGANCIIRPSICPETNFFFTFGIDGNPVTGLLMQLIPIPFVYLLPMLLPLAAVDCGLCALAGGSCKKTKV